MAKSKCLLVGAIDFGTTFSGWAYSFKHDFESEPSKAFVYNWLSGSSTPGTEKTPTCALISADGEKLVAFGYDAENKYKDLAEDGKHRDYFYFRCFKMALNNQKLSRDLKIEDEMGKPLSAIKVFSLSIEYLTDHMLGVCQDRIVGGLTKEDVHWVITVPAIWSDGAKQFMKEAAKEARLNPGMVTLALEPEAASVFCRYLPAERSEDKIDIATFATGTHYLILDAGGGTIDITVHEISSSGGLKEVHAATGGGWGGTLVDKEFKDLLIKVFGRKVYDTFTKTETEDWFDLWRAFEVKKKTVEPGKNDKITMKFPISLLELFKEENGHSLEDSLKLSTFSMKVELKRDKMMFSSDIFKELFDESITKTISCVKDVLQDKSVGQVKAILMVGGFSSSRVLKDAINREFGHLKIINPQQASAAILCGAVIFGHNPLSIAQRVLKKTYGTDVSRQFIEGTHPEKKRIVYDDRIRCKDLFSKHAEKGHTVTVGESQAEHSYRPATSDATKMSINIYASDLNNPTYVDEGCIYIGKLKVDLSSLPEDMDRRDKSVSVSFTFSDTEIKASARIEKTSEVVVGTFDFLG